MNTLHIFRLSFVLFLSISVLYFSCQKTTMEDLTNRSGNEVNVYLTAKAEDFVIVSKDVKEQNPPKTMVSLEVKNGNETEMIWNFQEKNVKYEVFLYSTENQTLENGNINIIVKPTTEIFQTGAVDFAEEKAKFDLILDSLPQTEIVEGRKWFYIELSLQNGVKVFDRFFVQFKDSNN